MHRLSDSTLVIIIPLGEKLVHDGERTATANFATYSHADLLYSVSSIVRFEGF